MFTVKVEPDGANAKIRAAVGDNSLIFSMDPDFEGILGLNNKVLQDKINTVQILTVNTIPQVLNDAIDRLISL